MSYSRPRFPDDHFTRIPNAWIRDPKLTSNAYRILSVILSHDADYKLSTAQIMRETGLGRDAVNAARDHMLERGYLVEVRQTTGERGRFAENHYVVTDCTGVPTPRGSEQSALFDPKPTDRTATVEPVNGQPVDGRAVDGQPGAIEEQREKNTPAPTEQGATSDRHLRAVDADHEAAEHLGSTAQAIASEHYEATGKLGGSRAFLALRGIVAGALRAGHAPEQIRPALAHLRARGRPVTNATLGPLLADPRLAGSVTGNGYGPRTNRTYGPLMEIPTDPDAHRGKF